MPYYSRPEEFVKRYREIFTARKDLLGFNYIAIQDENLLPEYPVLEISSGGLLREIHGTQKFRVTFELNFWIYHANYESTHADRTVEDMELATKVVNFLHQPEMRTLQDVPDEGGNPNRIMFGFVTQEIPGVAIAGQERVIATRLVWQGQCEVNYNDS